MAHLLTEPSSFPGARSRPCTAVAGVIAPLFFFFLLGSLRSSLLRDPEPRPWWSDATHFLCAFLGVPSSFSNSDRFFRAGSSASATGRPALQNLGLGRVGMCVVLARRPLTTHHGHLLVVILFARALFEPIYTGDGKMTHGDAVVCCNITECRRAQ